MILKGSARRPKSIKRDGCSNFALVVVFVFIITFSANIITTTVVEIRRRRANAYIRISFINQAELWIVPVVFFPHRR